MQRRLSEEGEMWVRKSEAGIQLVEISKDQRRKNLWRPLAVTTALMAIGVFAYSLGLRSCSQGIVIASSRPTQFTSGTTAVWAVLFLIFFGLALYRQRRHGGLFTPDNLLCRDCKEPSHFNPEMRCPCGGRLESLDYFDWIPESEIAGTIPEKNAVS